MKIATSDSISLARIDGEVFTIVSVEKSNYENNGEVKEGVKITTKESFTIEEVDYNKFHTTREIIVKDLLKDTYQEGFAKGDTLKVSCVNPEGKKYFVLKNA